MATSRDVARLAHVSQATVSRVFNDSSSVSSETRIRVIKAASELGYVPNGAARTMKTGRSGNIGVVVDDLSNPFYPELLEALDVESQSLEYRLVVWLAGKTANLSAIKALRSGQIDGLLFTTANSTSADLELAMSQRKPIILLNRRIAELNCDQVFTDNFEGGRLVAEHFIENGHRDFGYIGGPNDASTSRDRYEGYIEGISRRGFHFDARNAHFGTYSHQSGVDGYRKLQAESPEVTAIFCANDLLAAGVIDGVREKDTARFTQVSIAGFDDVSLANWSTYDLTTIKQNTRAMARWAISRMRDRLDDPSIPFVTKALPPELIVRSSSKRNPHSAGL
jgi:LacI family transcriptional regulator